MLIILSLSINYESYVDYFSLSRSFRCGISVRSSQCQAARTSRHPVHFVVVAVVIVVVSKRPHKTFPYPYLSELLRLIVQIVHHRLQISNMCGIHATYAVATPSLPFIHSFFLSFIPPSRLTHSLSGISCLIVDPLLTFHHLPNCSATITLLTSFNARWTMS